MCNCLTYLEWSRWFSACGFVSHRHGSVVVPYVFSDTVLEFTTNGQSSFLEQPLTVALNKPCLVLHYQEKSLRPLFVVFLNHPNLFQPDSSSTMVSFMEVV